MNKFVIGNWKMHGRLADAVVLADWIRAGMENISDMEVVLCPPSVWLYPIEEVLRKTFRPNLSLGAQNIYPGEEGELTGEISAWMIENLCQYVIVGHSERRAKIGESDKLINQKLLAALKYNLKPILCVGELKENAKKEKLDKRILSELMAGLKGVSPEQIKNVIIAYEPVWAIGTGNNASGTYAAWVIDNLRAKIKTLYGTEMAQNIPVIYGGSVNQNDVLEYISQPTINGVLAGGVSLNAKEFLSIVQIFSRIKKDIKRY